MTVTSADFDLVFFEQLSDERICTPYGPECDKVAKWLVIKSCCGVDIPLCDEHKKIAEKEVGSGVSSTTYTCLYCKHWGPVWFRIEPI